jgi:DNA/RNA endonuclease YhcR with UshA esterase domain
MRLAAFVLVLALAGGPAAYAANIDVKDAAAHVGQTATVVGVLSNMHQARNSMIFIDMGGVYPANTFSAVVFATDADKFGMLQALIGKRVGITGQIKMYHDKPEIVLTAPDQIKQVK